MGSSHLQGALWSAGSEVWSQTLEPMTRPLFDRVLDELGIGPGTRLLDAGCGSGLAMQLAVKRGGEVSGIDAAAGMLTIARQRVPRAKLHEGDLEQLPFGDGRFDAITAFNSIQYAAEPRQALGELRRVSVPGARVALATWAESERCETRVVLSAIGSLLPPPPPGAGGPFALSPPGALERLVEAAGFEPQRANEVAVELVFANTDEATRAHLSAGPARKATETAGVEAVSAAVAESLESSIRPDASSVQRNAFRYLIAAV